MSTKLKLGVVGAGGAFNMLHSDAWEQHPEIEIVAICDINREKAEAAALRFNKPRIYTDYKALLSEEKIDIIDICTPNLYHSEIAIAALNAGIHVFCEKPDAINPEEGYKMKQAAETSGKVLMVMRNNRFRLASQFIKTYVEKEHMGEIYAGRCGWIRRRGIPGKGGWFTTKELSGGGPLIDLGVHFLDLALWFMGSPKAVSVVGSTYTKFADTTIKASQHSKFGEQSDSGIFDVEDLVIGFIRFENEASLQIECSWASNTEGETNYVELRGTKSGINFINGDLTLYSEIEGTLVDIKPRFFGKEVAGHSENLNHFIDVVQGRDEPIFTIDQGLAALKIISALYESSHTGKEIRL